LPTGPNPVIAIVYFVAAALALGVLYAWGTSTFRWLAARRRAFAVALASLILVDRLANWAVVRRHDDTAGVIHAFLAIIITTFVLSAVPVALVMAVARAMERRSARRSEPPAPGAVSRRQVIEGAGGAVLFGATGTMLGWGMVRGRHAFQLEEVPLRVPGLPRALDGYVIAQVSDLHAGSFVGDRELDQGFALVRKARPDLVVVTGDMVDFDPAFAPLVARKLAGLTARDGVVAIPGNHDYYAGVDQVMAVLRAAGVRVLRDDGLVMRGGDGGGFALLGVDDAVSERFGRDGPQLDKAIAAVPDHLPRILLSHQPMTIDRWPGDVAVQLSGHTHGGQINPGFSPLGLTMQYVAGLYTVGGTTLYVNRGFGTVGAPSRVGAPPEVTRFVLVAA
jgi:predicted MPP superfamily phosphohydrolase